MGAVTAFAFGSLSIRKVSFLGRIPFAVRPRASIVKCYPEFPACLLYLA